MLPAMASHQGSPDLTGLLNAWADGDVAARDALFERVYPEIRTIAARQRGRRGSPTFEATEVVHEAYLRLTRRRPASWRHRAQFFKLAAEVVRQVLVDHSRRRRAGKRGGAWQRCDTALEGLADPEPRVDLLALDAALSRLASIDSQAARIVELRYFAGLSIPETAATLEIGTATVSRRWQVAQAWLRREL